MAKISLTLKDYDAVCNEIENWYGIKLTTKQMKEILADNFHLLCHIAEDVICDSDYKGLGSTSVREDIINHIGIKLTGNSWPTGATPQRRANAFFKKFKKEAIKAGYEVDIDV